MKGIYLLAMTAVVAMCLVPVAVEESDADVTYMVQFHVMSDTVATCTSDEIVETAAQIPESVYLREGYTFLGWALYPTATSPADLTILNGQERSMTLYAIYAKDSGPVPEPDFDWTPVISAVIILGLIASVLAVWYATKR